MALNLSSLQKTFWKQRGEILQSLKDDSEREHIQEELDAVYEQMKNLDQKLQDLHRSANRSNRSTRRNRKKRASATYRRRVHPEFARLGLSVPVSQKVGSVRVPLCKKPKTNG